MNTRAASGINHDCQPNIPKRNKRADTKTAEKYPRRLALARINESLFSEEISAFKHEPFDLP